MKPAPFEYHRVHSLEEVFAQLSQNGADYLRSLANTESKSELVARLLTTVYQSTANSSDTTRDAARGVAEASPVIRPARGPP